MSYLFEHLYSCVVAVQYITNAVLLLLLSWPLFNAINYSIIFNRIRSIPSEQKVVV